MSDPKCQLSEPDDFVGLQGAFYGYWPGYDPDEFEHDRGDYDSDRMSKLDPGIYPGPHNSNTPWFMPNYASGGDYWGGRVTSTNYDVLLEKAVELDQDPSEVPDECRPFFSTVYGGHGSYGILFHVERTPKEILEMLGSLENYPILDENRMSEAEFEDENEAWENWAASDYQKALERAFEDKFENLYKDDYLEIDLDDVDLDEHFRHWAEATNEYWEHSDSGAYIDVESVAKAAADAAESVEDLPEGAVVEGEKKTPGDRLYEFFYPPGKDDFDLNGLQGELLRFPFARRKNQIDIEAIKKRVALVRKEGHFRKKPGPFDRWAPAVQYLRMKKDLQEPVEPETLIIGYTHDYDYAVEVASALYDVLRADEVASLRTTLVYRIIPQRL